MGVKRSARRRDPVDTGTVELSARHVVRPERKNNGATYVRVMDGNNLDKLLLGGDLSPEEHSILTGFQVDLHRANLLGPQASTWDARVSTSLFTLTSSEAEHRLKVNKCLDFIRVRNGREVMVAVLDLCLSDNAQDTSLLRTACSTIQRFRDHWSPPEDV